jgi:FG-GAP repeat
MQTCCALLTFISLAIGINASDQANTRLSQPIAMSWSELATLGSGKSFNEDNFGADIAISEDQKTVVVGAEGWGSGGAVGAAYVFVEPPGGWTSTTNYTAKLTSGTQNKTDYFGSTVAISGDVIVVGAPSVLHHDSPYGSAYVFVKPASGWKTTSQFAAELTGPKDQGVQGGFAGSVAIAGRTIVVGGAEDSAEDGLTFVFVEPRNGWVSMTPTCQLSASDGFPGNQFGTSVAIDDKTIAVGAIQDDGGGGPGPGEAYVFVEPEGGWTNGTETARLLASDGRTFDWFGISASVMGNTVAIGAWESNVGAGAAYIFVQPPSGWRDTTETAELTASDGRMNDEFGTRVAIWGDTVFAGAPNRPAVYEFLKPEGGWETTSHFDEELQPPGKAEFGRSVVLGSKTLVIGGLAGDHDSSPAAAFVLGR